jgi:P-type Mg2+ transporter
MLMGMLLPFTTLGTVIGRQMLPLAYFPRLIVTLLAYCIMAQVVKRSYLKRGHSWL